MTLAPVGLARNTSAATWRATGLRTADHRRTSSSEVARNIWSLTGSLIVTLTRQQAILQTVTPIVARLGKWPSSFSHFSILRVGASRRWNKIFSLGMLCWNIALLPTQRRQSAIADTTAKFAKSDEDKNVFRSMIEMMVTRHERMFPRLHQQRASDANDEHTTESTREGAQ